MLRLNGENRLVSYVRCVPRRVRGALSGAIIFFSTALWAVFFYVPVFQKCDELWQIRADCEQAISLFESATSSVPLPSLHAQLVQAYGGDEQHSGNAMHEVLAGVAQHQLACRSFTPGVCAQYPLYCSRQSELIMQGSFINSVAFMSQLALMQHNIKIKTCDLVRDRADDVETKMVIRVIERVGS